MPPGVSEFMNSVVFLLVPYSLLYLYGAKLSELSNRQILAVSGAFLFVFIAMAMYLAHRKGDFVHTQQYKYPPQLYYLAYAMFVLNFIYWACRNYLSRFHYRWVEWLSANSLWIYLWHIFAIYLWLFFLPPAKGYLPLVVAKFAFLLVFSATATLAQQYLAQRLKGLRQRRSTHGTQSLDGISAVDPNMK
jgi:peptidoglycan/LPS O-acetylase OafA/YrhL